ncbi:hypothetical protein LSCM1_06697 [Leishmania martiniquensis]|uniref:Uncharacterized protein n=1 Tax=Leishmania martiniquensis TaxID=1580590 RepID=A0A836GTG8_9TRYP|nr:hypothetical protein LSCM1_06697 [Leishmania martiniquensis]
MREGRHAALPWSDGAVTHRAQALTTSAALQAEGDYSVDEADCGYEEGGEGSTVAAGEPFRLSSLSCVGDPWPPPTRRRSLAASALSRPPVPTAVATAASSTARSHSPAVWVFAEDNEDSGAEESHMEEGYGGRVVHAENLGSDPYHAHSAVMQRRRVVEDDDLDNVGAAHASSLRVPDNRFRFFSPPVAAGGGGKSKIPAWPYRELLGIPPPPEAAGASRPLVALKSVGEENSSAPADTSSLTMKAKVKRASSSSRPCSSHLRRDVAHAQPSITDALSDKENKESPTPCSLRSRAWRSPPSRTASPRPSASSSMYSASRSSAAPGFSPLPPRSVPVMRMAEASHASSPGGTERPDRLFFGGLGPLLVVHLDVLPELAGAQSLSRQENGATDESASAATAAEGSPSLSHSPPMHMGPYWEAFISQQERDTHEREVAALHARLENADQQLRIVQQQVAAAAEIRAAELVQEYKADERKRRAQFQTALDALREENRELTAKLEATARTPVIGGLRATTCPVWTSSGDAAAEARETAAAAASGSLVASAAAVSQAEMTRQLKSLEAYWRYRLRIAERHWEDEVSRQTRQRREALDQVEELVRTVEQLQEELRYTRRQAARLREENTRLCGLAKAASAGGAAALALPTSSVTTPLPEEVSRLRQSLKEHQHKEAALLAQVESYGEEATRVRLRYEAALEKAEQELEAERRRSTEMVKLCGSQLESLHGQLREGRSRGAAH